MTKKIRKKEKKKEIKHRIPENPEEAELELNQMSDITWRIFRIMSEFVEGFQFLSEFRQEVTVFGSARFKSNNKWYKEARKLGSMLAKEKYPQNKNSRKLKVRLLRNDSILVFFISIKGSFPLWVTIFFTLLLAILNSKYLFTALLTQSFGRPKMQNCTYSGAKIYSWIQYAIGIN